MHLANVRRLLRAFGVGAFAIVLILGMGSISATVSAEDQAVELTTESSPTSEPTGGPEATESPAPVPSSTPPSAPVDNTSTLPSSIRPMAAVDASGVPKPPPYGAHYPITVETSFTRPPKAVSSVKNSDFSQLNELERLIRGSYMNQQTGKMKSLAERKGNSVRMTILRMGDAYRVGRELKKAAKYGVKVWVIHPKIEQTKDSRSLQKYFKKYKNAHFKICSKKRGSSCLSSVTGSEVHEKLLMVNDTYDRDGNRAKAAIWSGSLNLGGPSGQQTWNNGWTVYNDSKLWRQFTNHWSDLWAKRNVGNNYLNYIKKHASKSRYGIKPDDATKYGYTGNRANYGMFYSNLADVTYYLTPIKATPNNNRDPVMMLLNRVKPDSQCRIFVQHNRFKYRRIAVAEKLVELSNKGCRVEAVAYRDEVKLNRIMHCQSWLRICKPILNVLRRSNTQIPAAWAKVHDKTLLVDAVLGPNKYNPEERLPNGDKWPAAGARLGIVQAGSASLTGSNLVASDEITTESTNQDVFEQYMQHWKALLRSREYRAVAY